MRRAKGHPRLWGLHNYQDVNRQDVRDTRRMLATVPGEVWLTETGGISASPARGLKTSARARRDRTKYMFKLAGRTTRSAPGCGRRSRGCSSTRGSARPAARAFDAGLVNPDGTPRPGVRRVREATPSTACRAMVARLGPRHDARQPLLRHPDPPDAGDAPGDGRGRGRRRAEFEDPRSTRCASASPSCSARRRRSSSRAGRCATRSPSGCTSGPAATRRCCTARRTRSSPRPAGPAAISGAVLRPLDGPRGMFDADDVRGALRRPATATRRARGSCRSSRRRTSPAAACGRSSRCAAVVEVAREAGMRLHMDGARLMNAVVAVRRAGGGLGAGFDTAWIDFTKGLGAPVGAVPRRLARADRRGVALQADARRRDAPGRDHRRGRAVRARPPRRPARRGPRERARARRGARRARRRRARPGEVETNIVVFDVADAEAPCAALERAGVRMGASAPRRVRAVTVACDRTDPAFADDAHAHVEPLQPRAQGLRRVGHREDDDVGLDRRPDRSRPAGERRQAARPKHAARWRGRRRGARRGGRARTDAPAATIPAWRSAPPSICL